MFTHKSYLRIGNVDESSNIFKDSYELLSCDYSFGQGIDNKGQTQTDIIGGIINLSIAGLPPTDIIQWALNPRKYHDGMLVFCDDSGTPLEKIVFQYAACIDMEINYSQDGDSYAATKLVLATKKIIVGNTFFENKWV